MLRCITKLLFPLIATGLLSAQSPGSSLTNQRIVDLSRAGLQESELIRLITTAPKVEFSFFPGAMDALLRAGVSEEVIKAMAARSKAVNNSPSPAAVAPAVNPVPSAAIAPPPVHPLPPSAESAIPRLQGASHTIRPGATVYIAPMMGNLDGFLASEFQKQKIPLTILVEETGADYILTGVSLPEDNRWYHIVFGGKDKNEASVRLISVAERRLVWAGEAGDRSLWAGSWKRGGQRKLADRIIHRMKRDIFPK